MFLSRWLRLFVLLIKSGVVSCLLGILVTFAIVVMASSDVAGGPSLFETWSVYSIIIFVVLSITFFIDVYLGNHDNHSVFSCLLTYCNEHNDEHNNKNDIVFIRANAGRFVAGKHPNNPQLQKIEEKLQDAEMEMVFNGDDYLATDNEEERSDIRKQGIHLLSYIEELQRKRKELLGR